MFAKFLNVVKVFIYFETALHMLGFFLSPVDCCQGKDGMLEVM